MRTNKKYIKKYPELVKNVVDSFPNLTNCIAEAMKELEEENIK